MLTRLTTYGAALTTALFLAAPALGAVGIVKQVRTKFGPRHDDTALCIAWHESTGDPWRFDPSAVSPTNDHGLFQIHDGLSTYGRRIYDVAFNIGVAWRMSRHGRDWSPWTGTYGKGMCHGLS